MVFYFRTKIQSKAGVGFHELLELCVYFFGVKRTSSFHLMNPIFAKRWILLTVKRVSGVGIKIAKKSSVNWESIHRQQWTETRGCKTVMPSFSPKLVFSVAHSTCVAKISFDK